MNPRSDLGQGRGNTPRVSVVIPAYRSAGFVAHAVEAALNQTMPDLEVLFIDDASGDDTAAIGERFAARDSRVRVLRNDQNLGTSGTVNRGIQEARGEWVAQLDHDDKWRPERLERMLEVADRADVISDDIVVVAEDSPSDKVEGFRSGSLLAQVGLRVRSPRELDLVEFIRADPGLVHPLLRRSFLVKHSLGLDTAFAIGADFSLWVLLLAHGARWIQLPEGYYLWERAPSAQSRRLAPMVEEAVRTTELLASNPLIAKNYAAVRALERRRRLFESHLAHHELKKLLVGRNVRALAALLLHRPHYVPLLLWRRSHFLRLSLTQRVDRTLESRSR